MRSFVRIPGFYIIFYHLDFALSNYTTVTNSPHSSTRPELFREQRPRFSTVFTFVCFSLSEPIYAPPSAAARPSLVGRLPRAARRGEQFSTHMFREHRVFSPQIDTTANSCTNQLRATYAKRSAHSQPANATPYTRRALLHRAPPCTTQTHVA